MGDLIRGRYEVLDLLGAGGQGEVLKARDRQHDRVVALKVRHVPSERDRQSVLREARLLLDLRPHPALPLVREDFFDADRYVIVMDWVEGRDLAQILDQEGDPGLALARVLRYVEQAAAALDHLHRHDPPVVHKDVTPTNLMVTADDRVVLIDFGLAHQGPGPESGWGTSGYLAPELAAGGTPSPATDVYALAATAFALVTGRAPDGLAASLEAVPSGRRTALRRALTRGLATDPSARPTAGQLLELLGLRPEGQDGLGDRLQRRLAAVWLAAPDVPQDGSPHVADRVEPFLATFEEIARQQAAEHHGTLMRSSPRRVLAHAPSTSDAIDAALAVREQVHERAVAADLPAQLRMSVHLGDVVISSDDVYGHGVDVAERLLEEAAPGRIVVSEDVWRQCRRRPELELVSLGNRSLAGLGEPIAIWEVAPPAEAPSEPETGQRTVSAPVGSLAILPFRIAGGGPDAELLAAGLHNDLITQLSALSSMSVISRTSVARYRDGDESVQRVAQQLNVHTVVRGSMHAERDRVRLTVELLDASSDTQLWSQTYDHELTAHDLFTIQSELTQRIVDSLHTELSTRDARELDTAPPPIRNLDVYRLTVEGRMQLDRKSPANLRRAAELFEHALQIEPRSVAAWTGLADALIELHGYGHGDDETLERGEHALQRALELDPDDAGARASLGLFLAHARRDGPGASREFERAIGLNPSYADAHTWYAWTTRMLGDGPASLRHALRGIELNPLSAEAVTNAAMSYLATGQPDRALVEARRAQELSPDFTSGRFWEGTALYVMGRFDDAVTVLTPLSREVAGQLSVPWAGMGPDATLALAHIADGTTAQAERFLVTPDVDDDPFVKGLVLLALGDTEEAFASFGAVSDTAYWPTLAIHHLFPVVWQPIRSDPRFTALVVTAQRSHGLAA